MVQLARHARCEAPRACRSTGSACAPPACRPEELLPRAARRRDGDERGLLLLEGRGVERLLLQHAHDRLAAGRAHGLGERCPRAGRRPRPRAPRSCPGRPGAGRGRRGAGVSLRTSPSAAAAFSRPVLLGARAGARPPDARACSSAFSCDAGRPCTLSCTSFSSGTRGGWISGHGDERVARWAAGTAPAPSRRASARTRAPRAPG